LHIIKYNFNTKGGGPAKSARPVATATFATIANPALDAVDAFSRLKNPDVMSQP